jgi:3-oxoacyl-(acyl-carrier-protein) synthase
MNPRPPVLVTGAGVVCAGANNTRELRTLLEEPAARFHIPTVFAVKHESGALPVAQVQAPSNRLTDGLPRTHGLALLAATEAVGQGPAPDAIVLGTTTGGIGTTESSLETGETAPQAYRFHGLDTVALHLAERLAVKGPVITVSTACSSASVAISIAAALLRQGLASRVLAGGADSLCRLTFHGFRQLQLVAPAGCAPLDANRAGMTVGEGAGFLLLENTPAGRTVLGALAGAGLSCDAHHATSPHPEGNGAVLAMRRALEDAGLEPADIGYVNLHGTGTPDNDAAEARAITRVFGEKRPALSSTKGLTGHALAAAGGIEAVIALLALEDGLLPANIGLKTPDETLALAPVRVPTAATLEKVMSNSFGFGGNNACVVLERAPRPIVAPAVDVTMAPDRPSPAMRVLATTCLTAHGGLAETWAALSACETSAGLVPDAAFAKAVPPAFVRRLKRLPRLMLALAQTVHAQSGRSTPPATIAVGTAWGPLAETREFLRKLFESGDQFSSPMDFIGSVHNAPAGQIALLLGCQAPNLTISSGERSFAQALLCAALQLDNSADSALVLAAEAFEPKLSPLLEPNTASSSLCSDGGAAFLLVPDDQASGARLRWVGESLDPHVLLASASRRTGYDAILVEGPAAKDAEASPLWAEMTRLVPAERIVPLHQWLGRHASVSATAMAIAAHAVVRGNLPLVSAGLDLRYRRLLLVNLGPRPSAMEVFA